MLKSQCFFLLGDTTHNVGPSNVNRSLVEHADGAMYHTCHTGWRRALTNNLKCIISCAVLCADPAGMSAKRIRLCHFFGTKVAYLMHGCLQYENEINRQHLPQSMLDREADILRMADTIICVSSMYAEWVKQRYPQHVAKITFVNNGMDIIPRPVVRKRPLTIALSGGNRPIKNNLAVCQAVEVLVEQGYDCKVYVFGTILPTGEDLSRFPFVTFMGQVSRENFRDMLDSIQLFVLNSEIEPFGLVLGDALVCHCSILLSQNVGAISVVNPQSCDVVCNPHDVCSLAAQMLHLLQHSNADRLLSTVDIDACSEQTAFHHIRQICLAE